MLKDASARSRRVRLGGNFSKHRFGGPLDEPDVVVSTAAMNQVLAYEPADLTISVGAGMPYYGLVQALAANQQMLALDPPHADESTVGGVVAANLSGPLRRKYGTARDQVIGMTFVTMAGRVVQTGGMVVKNVAGLDMAKLMIGSLGTLAAVTTVNFKLAPLPEQTQSYIFKFAKLEEALQKRTDLLRGVLQPQALDLLSPRAAWRLGMGETSLILLAQAAGSARVLERFRNEYTESQAVDGAEEKRMWRQVRDFTKQYSRDYPEAAVVRISSSLGELQKPLSKLTVPWICRAGNGVTYACFAGMPQAVQWAEEAAREGIRCVVESGPPAEKAGALLWPETGSDFPVMERVKSLFDPERLLNRGRLYGRI